MENGFQTRGAKKYLARRDHTSCVATIRVLASCIWCAFPRERDSNTKQLYCCLSYPWGRTRCGLRTNGERTAWLRQRAALHTRLSVTRSCELSCGHKSGLLGTQLRNRRPACAAFHGLCRRIGVHALNHHRHGCCLARSCVLGTCARLLLL